MTIIDPDYSMTFGSSTDNHLIMYDLSSSGNVIHFHICDWEELPTDDENPAHQKELLRAKKLYRCTSSACENQARWFRLKPMEHFTYTANDILTSQQMTWTVDTETVGWETNVVEEDDV